MNAPSHQELAVSIARVEERVIALTDAVEKSNKRNYDEVYDLRKRIVDLEKSRWRHWTAMILIAAGMSQAPPWLANILGL
jgi:hypothetical protein